MFQQRAIADAVGRAGLPAACVASVLEFRAGRAKDIVAGPAKIAKCDIVTWPMGGQRRLEVAKLFHLRNQRVADQYHPVFYRRGGEEHIFVGDGSVEFPVAREGVVFHVGFTGRQLGQVGLRQSVVIDSHVVDAAQENFAVFPVRPNARGGTAGCPQRSLDRFFADDFSVEIQSNRFAVVRGGNVMPLAVRQLGLVYLAAELPVPANVQPEPESPKRAFLADGQQSSAFVVLLPVDALPVVGDFIRSNPRADRRALAGLKCGVTGCLDPGLVEAEPKRLPVPALDEFKIATAQFVSGAALRIGGLILLFDHDDGGFAELARLPVFIPGLHLPPNLRPVGECLACTGDVFVFRGKPVAAVPDVADVSMKFSEFAGDEHAVTGLPLRLPRKGVLVQRQPEFVRHGTGNEGVWGGLNLLGSESN